MKSSTVFFIVCCLPYFLEISGSELRWSNFKRLYGKKYASVKEEIHRQKVFLDNVKLIEEHNKRFEAGLETFSLKINQLVDQTHEERFGRSSDSYLQPRKSKAKNFELTDVEVPESIDWRDYGVITPVADQMSCESCWAFATTATLEAHVGIYENRTVLLSQQNLDDCVYSNFSCSLDLIRTAVSDAYQYIQDNGGLDTLESYPYLNYIVNPCAYNANTVGAQITGFVELPEGDEEALKMAVATMGPVTVEITTDFTWSVYQSGVYYKENCLNTTLPFNHAVVVVGYGTEEGQDYWLVKNSWNIWYGLDGYIKMARNRENNCGIASYARYPILS